MPIRTYSDGRTYPSSGAATASALGLSAAAGLTFAPAPGTRDPNMPMWFIGGNAARSETNATCSYRLNATSGAGSPFNGAFTSDPVYGSGAWIYAEIVDPAAFTASAASFNRSVVLNQNHAGTGNFQLIASFEKGTVDPVDTSWLCFTVRNATTDAGSLGLSETGSGVYIAAYNATRVQQYTNPPTTGNFPFNRWVFLGMNLQSGSSGFRTLYMNGQPVASHPGLVGTYNAVHDSGWTWTLPAIPGVRWWVFEPESWDGADWPKASGPLWLPEDCNLAKGIPSTMTGMAGAPWTETLTGTATAENIPYIYATGGNTAHERRVVSFGTTGGTVTRTTAQPFGELPFNAEGWFTLDFNSLQPRGLDYQWLINDAGGSALITIDFFAATNTFAVSCAGGGGGSLAFPSVGNARQRLFLHLNRNGEATMTVTTGASFSLSTVLNQTTARSARVGPWRPGPLGTIRYSSAGGANSVCEVGGVRGWRRPRFLLVDSYTHGETTSYGDQDAARALVPNTRVNAGQPFSASPDGHCPAGLAFYAGSQGNIQVTTTLGRSGHRMTAFTSIVLPALQWTRGCEFDIEGGFPNDTARATTGALAVSVAAELGDAFATFAAYCVRTRQKMRWKKPAKGNSSEMTGGFPGECFDRSLVLVQQRLNTFASSGFVEVLPQYAATIAGLHPDGTEAALSARNSQKTGSNSGSRVRFRDRRAGSENRRLQTP